VRRHNKYRGFYDGEMLPDVDLSAPSQSWPDWFGKVDADLIQYTGVKSNDGAEIYEGDIIKSGGWWGNPKIVISEVIFKNGRFETDGAWLEDYELCDLSIVGNIYENPELLEAKQ